MATATGWAALPVSVSLQGVVGELQQALVKPTEQAAKAAGAAINKNVAPEVDKLDKAVRSAQYRQKKATDEQIAAERKLVDAKSKAEQAVRAVEAAEANRAVAVSKAGTKVADAEAKYKSVLSDSKSTAEQVERAEQALNIARSAEKSTILTQENKLASARDKSRTAALGVEKAEQGVVDAMSEAKRAADSLEDKQKSLKDAQDGVSDSASDSAQAVEGFASSADKADGASGRFHLSLKNVAVGAAAISAAVVGAGKAAYELGSQFDDAYDSIRVGTGASGDALAGLEDSMRKVAGESIGVGSDIGEIGSTLADLNTRLGVTGEPLERLTTQFQQLKGMGIDADINDVTGAFTQFGIEADKAPEALDDLFRISQATGKSITEITSNLDKSGPALQQFGFGLTESAGLLGALDKAGLDSEKTLGSMTKALGVFAKEGKDPQEALWGTIDSIDELTKAGKNAEAIDLANSIFGAKGGAGFVAAVQSGKFSYDDFMGSIGASGDTISGVAEETADFAEKWDQFKNKAMLAIEPVATAVFNAMVPALEKASGAITGLFNFLTQTAIPAVKDFGSSLQDAGKWVEDNKGKLLGFAAAVSPVLVPLLVGLGIHWTALGTKATLSAVAQVRAWAVTKAEAIKSAAISLVNLWKLGAGWIATGAQAMLGAGRVAAAWAIAKAQAAGALVASIAAVGAGWIATGARALIGAGQVAAAWVIGLGPIAWVTAAIAAVVGALTWFFTQTETGKAVWASFTSFLSSAWQATVDALIGAWNWVKTTVIDAWNFAWAGVQANWALVTGALSSGWTWLKDTFVAVWTWIKTAVLDAWNAYWAQVQVNFQILTGGLMAAWTWVKDSFVMVWNIVKTAVLDAWNLYWGLVQSGFQITMNALTGAWNWMKDMLSAGWNFIRDAVINAFQNALNVFRGVFQGIMNALSGSWDFLKNAMMAGWNWINSNVLGGFRSGLDALKGWFETTVDAIGRTWNRVKELTAKPIKFVVDTVFNNGIRKAWNAVVGFIGMDDKKMKSVDLGPLAAYKTGGVLPGYTPGRDVHNFVSPTGGRLALSGGEAIMRPEWTRAVGGPAAVEQMNRAARTGKMKVPDAKQLKENDKIAQAHAMGGVFQAFANGGVVGAMERIIGMKYPMLVPVFSGYRPSADNHGRGLAGDFSNGTGNTPEMIALANDIANTYPGSMELIHEYPGFNRQIKNGQFVGGGGGSWGYYAGAGDHANHVHWAMDTPPTIPFGGGVFKGGSSGGGGGGFFDFVGQMVKPVWDKIIDAIPKYDKSKGWAAEVPGAFLKKGAGLVWDFVKEKASLFGGGGGGGNIDTSGVAGTNIQIGQELAKRAGWTGGEWEALKQLWHNESNWNHLAQNPTSTAYGIPQFLDSTWSTVGYQKTSDPATQIAAGIKYIKQRPDYGVPSKALSLWQSRSPHWYDNGGYLKPGTTEVRNDTGKPEPVFTAEQWAVLRGNILTNAQAQNWQGIAKDLKTIARGYQKWWATSDEAKKFTESAQKSAEDAALGGAKSALAPYGLDPLVDLGTGVAKRVESAWDASGMDVGMQGRNIVVNIDAEEGQDTISINQLQRLEKDVDWLKVNVNRKPKAAVTTRGGVM
ncbi:aggregation-promoting factor C-terminal-like domain-containing protein [Corynebacterium dentalis]|uniref:aggregation-promoting factor C-terminal-like domain-containing protein n=1 Tax=Corynebacterium dentalis TaxID=2014528 RepID=UPI00289E56FC|nr:phage tail tape measure protein [Corynebacterium dentalis]